MMAVTMERRLWLGIHLPVKQKDALTADRLVPLESDGTINVCDLGWDDGWDYGWDKGQSETEVFSDGWLLGTVLIDGD